MPGKTQNRIQVITKAIQKLFRRKEEHPPTQLFHFQSIIHLLSPLSPHLPLSTPAQTRHTHTHLSRQREIPMLRRADDGIKHDFQTWLYNGLVAGICDCRVGDCGFKVKDISETEEQCSKDAKIREERLQGGLLERERKGGGPGVSTHESPASQPSR